MTNFFGHLFETGGGGEDATRSDAGQKGDSESLLFQWDSSTISRRFSFVCCQVTRSASGILI